MGVESNNAGSVFAHGRASITHDRAHSQQLLPMKNKRKHCIVIIGVGHQH